MRNDFEQLVWLYSMGVEQVGVRQPTNYSKVKIVKRIDEVANQDISALKKTEEIRGTESEKLKHEVFQKEIKEIMENLWHSKQVSKEL